MVRRAVVFIALCICSAVLTVVPLGGPAGAQGGSVVCQQVDSGLAYDISWQAYSGAAKYAVYRTLNGGAPQQRIVTSNATDLLFTGDFLLPKSGTVVYSVAALDAANVELARTDCAASISTCAAGVNTQLPTADNAKSWARFQVPAGGRVLVDLVDRKQVIETGNWSAVARLNVRNADGTVGTLIGSQNWVSPYNWPNQKQIYEHRGANLGMVASTTDVLLSLETVTDVGIRSGEFASTHIMNVRVVDSAGNVMVANPCLSPRYVNGGAITPGERLGGSNPALPCLTRQCGQTNETAWPVDVATGNFWHTFGGLSIPGRGMPLNFGFTYNSTAANADGPLGFGWTHSYNMRLGFTPNPTSPTTVTVSQENGSQVNFFGSGTTWAPPPRANATLTKNGDGTWTYTRRGTQAYTFDSTGRLVSMRNLTDPATGYTTTVTYPSSTQMVVTDPAGRTLTFTLNASGRVTSVADSTGRSVSFTYTGSDLTGYTGLIANTTLGASTWAFAYDTAHRMTKLRKPNESAVTWPGTAGTCQAGVLCNTYDDAGRTLSQTDQIGRISYFSYGNITDAAGITDPRGNKSYKVIIDGLLISEQKGYTTSLARNWKYTYDPNTLGVTKITLPDNRTVQMSYDTAGNVLSTTDPLGRQQSWTYNAFNQVLTATSPNPGAFGPSTITTTNTYDTGGRLLTTATPLFDAAHPSTPVTVQTTYTRADTAHPEDVTSVTDPEGRVTTFTYDPATGYLLTATDPLGNTATTCYDTLGRPTEIVPPRGGSHTCGAGNAFKTTTTYNQYGLPLVVTTPTGATTSTYDKDTNLKTQTVRIDTTPANDQTTTWNYDAAGQSTSITRADGTTITNEYWPDGRLKTQKDGATVNLYQYNHDALGRLTTQTDALGLVTNYTYKPLTDNVATITDPANSCGTGVRCVTTMTTNNGDELTGVSYSDGTTPAVTYTYNPAGLRATMTDGTGTSTYTYDSLARVTSTTDGAAQTVGYGYDRSGRQTSLAYPSGIGTVTTAYDAGGRPDTVTDWAGRVYDYTLNADGNISQLDFKPSASGAAVNTDTSTYNNIGQRLTSAYTQGVTPLAGLTYTRDQTGRLTSETTTGTAIPTSNRRYGYTKLDQLCYDAVTSTTGGTCASPPSGAIPYAYDSADNLTTLPGAATQRYNTANQLCWTSTTASTNNCATPPAGATTYTHDPRGNRTTQGTTTYTYDQANRLKTSSGTTPATYTYNGDGQRATKTSSLGNHTFVWAGGALLKDGSNTYIYGPDGAPLAQVAIAGGTVTYLHIDQLGSIRLTTDATGAASRGYTYDPYGTNSATTGTGTDSTFRYAGQYQDPETGLYYMRARYYDSLSGAFISSDPAVAVTRSRYSYVNGGPLNAKDPSGLDGLYLTDVCIRGVTCDINKDSIGEIGAAWLTEEHPSVAQGIIDFASGVMDFNAITAATDAAGWSDTGQYANKCSGWYRAGQATMFGIDVWMSGGTQAARFRDSSLFGRSSALFGRGGKAGGGMLNRTWFRLGWSWKGSATTGQDVFRIGAGHRKWHLEIWEVGESLGRGLGLGK